MMINVLNVLEDIFYKMVYVQLVIQVALNMISKLDNVSDANKVTESSITDVNMKTCTVNLSAQKVIVKIVNVYIF